MRKKKKIQPIMRKINQSFNKLNYLPKKCSKNMCRLKIKRENTTNCVFEGKDTSLFILDLK